MGSRHDGRTIYHSRFDEPGIWSMPASGGRESVVVTGKPATKLLATLGRYGEWTLPARRGCRAMSHDRVSTTLPLAALRQSCHLENNSPWQPSLSASRDGRHRLLLSVRSPERDQDGRELPLGRTDSATVSSAQRSVLVGLPVNMPRTWRFGVFELDAPSGELRRNGTSSNCENSRRAFCSCCRVALL